MANQFNPSEHPRESSGKFANKQKTAGKGDVNRKNIPYSIEKYNEDYNEFFNSENSIGSKPDRKPLIFGKSVVFDKDIDYKGVSKIGFDNAYRQLKNNYYFYNKPFLENEGYSTTNDEMMQMADTDDLEPLLDAKKVGERMASLAGIEDGRRKVLKALDKNTLLDINFYKDLNASFARARRGINFAGKIRGTVSPGVSTHIPLKPQGTFIPQIPEYLGKNLIKDIEQEISKIIKNPTLENILKFDSIGVYNQYFYDGNTRTNAFYAYAWLIKTGYKPFDFEFGDVRLYGKTKQHLIKTSDGTKRVQFLLERI